MLVGIHSLKPQVAICGVSPIILSVTSFSSSYDPYVEIVVSGSQPINWFNSATNYGATIANNTPIDIYNAGYGWTTHCVTFTNSYGTTGMSFSLYSSDPSP